MQKKIIMVVLSLLICAALVSCEARHSVTTFSEEEQSAYECVLQIKEKLKEPESIKIYDRIYLLKKQEATQSTIYTIFKYGGRNSYGNMVTNVAVFVNGDYLMDYADDVNWNKENAMEQLRFKIDVSLYELQLQRSETTPSCGFKLLTVDAGKIENKAQSE